MVAALGNPILHTRAEGSIPACESARLIGDL
jgi:hypothetical protein